MNKSFSGNYFCHLTLLVLSAVILLSPESLLSQGYLKAELRSTNCPVSSNEADRWFFGQNAGLDFRPQNPEADPSNYLLNVFTSPAIMADSTGNILFYTNGMTVFNRQLQAMPNGNDLHGYPSHTMPAIIIPKPGSDSIYYIFTTHSMKANSNDPRDIYGLEYNEVNMNRNNGQGDITAKYKKLLPPEVSSKLSAVLHSNGVDFWVVAHKFNSDEFCSFKVTSNGVDSANYISSHAGTFQSAPGETNNGLGYMKISPDGTKLALAILGLNRYELFNFNNSTGEVTLITSSPAIFIDAYGIEFSSDSEFLYATTTSPSEPSGSDIPKSYLYQFTVDLGPAIFSSGNYEIIDSNIVGSYFGGMQIGTDGRIYVSRSPYGSAAVSVIQNPKRPGQACNFVTDVTDGAIDLQGKKSRYGFPNFMQSYFDLPHFDVENVCFEDGTIFNLQNNSNIDNISWQFSDPAGNPPTSTDIAPTCIFSSAGTYQVQVTEYFGGNAYGPYTETVLVNELPPVDIGDTVYMYPGSPILLDAGAGYVSYEWSTGENTQSVTISNPGIYDVTVQNERCCLNVDSVLVIYFDVMVPNAFRPGGTNGVFRAYASSLDAIRNFTMYIFNRWGQQIYVSSDINQGWDGRIDGKDAPGDVYVWLINYDVERVGKTERIAYKGNVILLR